jgi:putative ABC transport system permease protein
VKGTTPIRYVPVRAGSDRKTMMTVDVASYRNGATVPPDMLSGKSIDGLARDPRGVIVSKEIEGLFSLKRGDTLPVTIFPDDSEKSRKVNFHVVGVYRSFPPTAPVSEMVIGTHALPPYLLPVPDFYLARDAGGGPPSAVAAELRRGGLERAFKVTTQVDQTSFAQPSVTALNLGPLGDIESVAAGLIAAVGVAVLGAFLVLERRREFATLEAVGADSGQILRAPAQEGVVTVAGSLIVGVPLGIGLAVIAVRLLGLFFQLPPPLVTIPVGKLLLLVGVMVAASAVALAVALTAVSRVAAANVLREP